jgi:hypothetical protein
MKSVSELLNWIVNSGGGILVASWALERIRGFQAQPPDNKRLITIAVSVGISLAAYAIMTYVPAVIMSQVNPWLTVAAGTVIVYSGGQVYHQATKNSGPPVRY